MCEIKIFACAVATLSLLFVDVLTHPTAGLLTDYSITPSSQVAYYHYPAPQRYQQLQETPQRLSTYQQLEQQMARTNVQQQYYQPHQQQQQVSYQQQQQQAAVSYQQQQQTAVSYQQPQQQQQYQAQQSQPSVTSYEYQPKQSHTAFAAQQFASPALENAAFSMALTNQGYAFSPPSSAAAAAASLASSATASSNNEQSLNVKLPVPFGITPITAEPLPIQAGTPFDNLRQITKITSYGTNHPLKRRR